MLRLCNHPKASHVDAPRVGHERALRYVGGLKRRSSTCVPMLAVRRVFQSANLSLVSPSTDLFAAGTDALERGAWEEARTHLQASLAARETPQVEPPDARTWGRRVRPSQPCKTIAAAIRVHLGSAANVPAKRLPITTGGLYGGHASQPGASCNRRLSSAKLCI